MKNVRGAILAVLLSGLVVAIGGCSGDEPGWIERNQRVIDANGISGRERTLPEFELPLVLAAGVPVVAGELPDISLAPGVDARLAWGRGALLERVEMQPGAVYPEQTLGEELIMIVAAGSATVEIDGAALALNRDDALYLEPGTTRAVTAGADGFSVFEVYSPVRLDHLALAGQDTAGVDVSFPDQGVSPSLEPGVVVNINEIQWTPLTDPVADLSYRRSSALSRLIWGRNAQISLVRMDPGSEFPLHIHPEDQLTHTTRGTLDQGVMDALYPVSAATTRIAPSICAAPVIMFLMKSAWPGQSTWA
jgi:gluconolactonase